MPDPLSRRTFRLVALAATVTIVSACAPSATLVSDPVFAELYLSEQEELRRIQTAAGEAGFELRTVTLDAVPSGREEVDAALARVDPGHPTVLSPLLSGLVSPSNLARDGGGPPVLLLGGPDDLTGAHSAASPADEASADADGDTDADNDIDDAVSQAVYNRVPAFGGLGTRVGGNAVVAYFRTDTAARRAELDAFRDGLGGGVESTRFVVFESPPDDAVVREELFRVRSPGVELVAAFLGSQNRLVLEEIRGMGTTPPPVATEDRGPAAAYDSLVSYSIERDYAGAVESFLSGRRGTIIVDARLVDRDVERNDRVP
jgi:hypothetical protein